MAKPDPRLFRLAADRLGVLPDECVFVDDNAKYLVGAQELGMKTILFESNEQFIRDLRKIIKQNEDESAHKTKQNHHDEATTEEVVQVAEKFIKKYHKALKNLAER